jgi:SWIM zinc finger
MSNTTEHTAKCQTCGRVRRFSSAAALASAAPSGRICRAKTRHLVAIVADAMKPEAHAKMTELIEDGGIVPVSRPGVYAATSSDGSTVYVVSVNDGTCTCKAGQNGRDCYHLSAALVLDAARRSDFGKAA